MIFGGWLTRKFARLWRPMAASGGLWRPHRESPRPPINTFTPKSMIRRLDCSILRC